MSTLNDPFGRSRLPGKIERADRIRLLGEFSQAALTGGELSQEALLFIGGAVSEWLAQGGNLERDFLKVVPTAGSHHTPRHVWKTLQGDSSSRGATAQTAVATIPEPSDRGRNETRVFSAHNQVNRRG